MKMNNVQDENVVFHSNFALATPLISNMFKISPVNPLVDTGNYSATSNNMKLVHWPLMGRLLRLVQR